MLASIFVFAVVGGTLVFKANTNAFIINVCVSVESSGDICNQTEFLQPTQFTDAPYFYPILNIMQNAVIMGLAVMQLF